ncbi:MAG: glycosyltransferase family 2 protein [Thiohalomonadales bacterium]
MEYDVSVILINYNSSSFTISCVESIIENTNNFVNYNIVIVDNSSVLDDFNKLNKLKDIKNVKVVRSNINLGFSCGNMYGVSFTKARYYFFLNNDCVLLNDCINILFKFSEENQNTGLCSPQLYSEENSPISSFDHFPILTTKFLGTGILKVIKGKEYKARKGIYNTPIKVDVVSGSQMFIRKEAFNNVGGFDPLFFLYCEEEDIALKMYNHQYDVYLVPDAKNIHLGGASTPKSYEIRKEFYISFLYFYRKHYGFLKAGILKLLLFLKIIRKSFKNSENFKLSFFVLSGAHMKNSIRHKQVIVEIDQQIENIV